MDQRREVPGRYPCTDLALEGSSKLSNKARDLLADPENEVETLRLMSTDRALASNPVVVVV
jgi:hypothetical protein